MEETFELYFDDLKEDVQKALLAFLGLNNPEEGNYDVFPIAEIYNSEL